MAETKGELIVLHDRRDRLEANRLVRKLESAGFRVARQDPATPRRFKQESPTVVLWSRHAAGRGLRSALDSDSAVIAKVDGRAAPFGAKVTDLRGWRGQDRHQGWKSLLEAVGPAESAKALAAKPVLVQAASTAPAASKIAAVKTPKAKADALAPAKTKTGSAMLPILVGVTAAIAVFAAAAALFLL